MWWDGRSRTTMGTTARGEEFIFDQAVRNHHLEASLQTIFDFIGRAVNVPDSVNRPLLAYLLLTNLPM